MKKIRIVLLFGLFFATALFLAASGNGTHFTRGFIDGASNIFQSDITDLILPLFGLVLFKLYKDVFFWLATGEGR